MTGAEIPVAFECSGQALIGVVHLPENPKRRGVLAIVAGGPQYRAGCCRQLVLMARHLADRGIPVMRFDYRGLGDGAGQYLGFEHVGEDLRSAVNAFLNNAPGVEEIVLWGGCDAAAASLIHGADIERVTGMILGNPWVHSEGTHAKVIVRHYYWRRIREKAFWKKLLSFRMDIFKTLASVLGNIKQAQTGGHAANRSSLPDGAPFPDRMLYGASRFKGRLLLMMSGLSLVSKEFDELVASSSKWQQALARLDTKRVDFPDADQAFSTIAARDAQIAAATEWLENWPENRH